jgi:hypothetical protein
VVGLEICGDAVKDAKRNAVANSVSNCEFEVGPAQETIPRVCAAHLASAKPGAQGAQGAKGAKGGEQAKDGGERSKHGEGGQGENSQVGGGVTGDAEDKSTPHQFGSCVAVLDPPREGVHWKVLQALRAAPEVERIVYISCNHTAWVEQARALCCAKDGGRAPGEPFRPVVANGVDLFPHTSHVELVVLFERGECLKRTLAAEVGAEGSGDPKP